MTKRIILIISHTIIVIALLLFLVIYYRSSFVEYNGLQRNIAVYGAITTSLASAILSFYQRKQNRAAAKKSLSG